MCQAGKGRIRDIIQLGRESLNFFSFGLADPRVVAYGF